MSLTLRDYQAKAVQSIYNYFRVNQGNPVLELPTSAGKSLTMAEFIAGVFASWPGQRILVLAHVKELVEQNALELAGHWEGAPIGINAATLKRRDVHHPIIFAMIQSVWKQADRLGWFDLVIIDECHLVPVRTNDGMYRQFLEDLRERNPALKVIGLSATPYRLDNGLLTEGENRIFTDIIPAKANGASIDDLLGRGFLSPLVTPDAGIKTKLSLEGVRKQGADYNQKQLAEAVDKHATTRAAVNEIIDLGADRKSWLIFATSVAHADHIANEINRHDIDAEVVTGNTPAGERRDYTERFKRQELRALINVNCLTTGFNARCVDLLAFLRPTHSTNLYVQMAGRGMRLSPETGKTDCLVLDFAGLIKKHGPVNDVKPPPRKGEGGGEAPIKECDQCFMLVPAGAKNCPYCDYEFPPNEITIDETASTADIIKKTTAPPIPYTRRPTRREVDRVSYHAHQKPGKPDSLKISYYDGLALVAREWVCIFHSGKAGAEGKRWWNENVGVLYQPGDILQAVEFAKKYARDPNYIYIQGEDGGFMRVVSRGYDDPETAEAG